MDKYGDISSAHTPEGDEQTPDSEEQLAKLAEAHVSHRLLKPVWAVDDRPITRESLTEVLSKLPLIS